MKIVILLQIRLNYRHSKKYRNSQTRSQQALVDHLRPYLIKLLGAYLGAYLSQIDRVRRLNKHQKVL